PGENILRRVDALAEASEPRLERLVSQQQTDRTILELQIVRQQRWIDMARVGNQPEQAGAQQRSRFGEAGSLSDPLLESVAEEMKRQIDGRPAASNVILQIRVNPFVTQVNFRG